MKHDFVLLLGLVFLALLSCDKAGNAVRPLSDEPITLRTNPCEGHSGVTVGISRDIASCKKDCDRGFGLRCGGYNYTCEGSVMTSYTPIEDKCPQSISGPPSNYSWEPMDTEMSSDTSRRVHMLLQALNRYYVKITFLSALPAEDLSEYPYFEVESNTVRWEYSPGYSFGTQTVYHYFQFSEGDYPIVTGTTPYGYTIVNITAY